MSMSQGPPRASHASGFMPQPSVSPFTAAPNGLIPAPGPGPGLFVAPPPPQPPPMSSALSIPQSRFEPPPLSATAGPMPGTLERPLQGPKKRLIVTCDGTWLDADNGIVDGHKQMPSNVSRIGWAIKDTSRDGIPQVVNYQAGVGTNGGRIARKVGGATGAGIKENIREAYTYLATNWRDGDEIFLIGFSRGAFTARSIGGIIGELGLLTRSGLPYFSEIFEDYEHKNDDLYISDFPDAPFKHKGPFNAKYVSELERHGMTRRHVPIKAICCWDTVGNLGIPRTPWLEMFSLRPRKLKDYQFEDTTIHPCVENAFQALALDEHRAPFSPALWEKRDNDQRTNLKQVWFPGVHANVGGGYDDQELSNLTLAWMMSRLEAFLDFRSDFLISQFGESKAYYKSTGQKQRWWGFGEIYRSLKGVYTITGSRTRTPGNYYRSDPVSGRESTKRLKNTNEYIHASVRGRIGLKGLGPEDRGVYAPAALEDWTYDVEPATGPGQGGNVSDGGLIVWNYRGDRDLAGQTRIPEAVLLETELALLRQFSVVEDYIKFMTPPSGHKDRRKSRKYANGDAAAAAGMGAYGLNNEKRRGTSLGPPGEGGEFSGPDDRDDRRERRRREKRKTLDPREERYKDYRDRSKKRQSARY